jgi:uncharacterized protein YcbX
MSAAQIQAINIYPIKSTAGLSLSNAWIDALGLCFDRRFVLTETNGMFITGRTCPKLCLVQANITASGLILNAPEMPVLTIDYQKFSSQYRQVSVWNDNINGQITSNHVNLWFSQYLDKPCQLVFFGKDSSRYVKNRNAQVAFSDKSPLSLVSQASLDDLNQRCSSFIDMAQFRQNVIVNDCVPFAEDAWQHIRIGEVEFEVIKPCSRCVFTTVDPVTAQKHPTREPFATLKSYRRTAKSDVLFGQHLVPLNQGQIKLSDKIVVLAHKTPPLFI